MRGKSAGQTYKIRDWGFSQNKRSGMLRMLGFGRASLRKGLKSAMENERWQSVEGKPREENPRKEVMGL